MSDTFIILARLIESCIHAANSASKDWYAKKASEQRAARTHIPPGLTKPNRHAYTLVFSQLASPTQKEGRTVG